MMSGLSPAGPSDHASLPDVLAVFRAAVFQTAGFRNAVSIDRVGDFVPCRLRFEEAPCS